MGNELRQIAPDDPVALELAEALRDEVEARQEDNGAARPTTRRNGDRGFDLSGSRRNGDRGFDLSGWTRTNG